MLRDSDGAFRKLRPAEDEEQEILTKLGAVALRHVKAKGVLKTYLETKCENGIAPFEYSLSEWPRVEVLVRFNLTGNLHKVSIIHDDGHMKYAFNVY